LFDKLKNFVVDPFEDTPEVILNRPMGIMDKAKQQWSPLNQPETTLEANIPQQPQSDEHSDDLRYRPANEVAAIQ
jgi:hypothetical protein